MLLFSLHNYRIVASLGLDKLSLVAFGVVVDTGAGPNLVRRNALSRDWLRQVVTSKEEEQVLLLDANNARLRTTGTVTLWLQTGARIVPVPFLVVDDLSVVLRGPAGGGGAARGAPEVRRTRRGIGVADAVGPGRNGDGGPAYERQCEPLKGRARPRRRRGVRVAAAGGRGRRQPTRRHAAVAARCARNGHSPSSVMIASGDFVCMEGIICIGW